MTVLLCLGIGVLVSEKLLSRNLWILLSNNNNKNNNNKNNNIDLRTTGSSEDEDNDRIIGCNITSHILSHNINNPPHSQTNDIHPSSPFHQHSSLVGVSPSPKEKKNENTCIIITSSWVQSHPTLYFIRKVVDSISLLKGLSPTVPIFINVDALPPWKKTKMNVSEYHSRLQQLDDYVQMLHHEYHHRPNVHILTHVQHSHISGSVQKTLALIEQHYPTMEFVYYMQHDFYFSQPINHTALVHTLREEDDFVKIVRFLYGGVSRTDLVDDCPGPGEPVTLAKHTIQLHATAHYSDNNHLANFRFYKHLLNAIGSTPRPPEAPLMVWRERSPNCSAMGLYMYMHPITGKSFVTLEHADGRLSSKEDIVVADHPR